jgi:hypothetical protein
LPNDFYVLHSADYGGLRRLEPLSCQRIEKDFALNDSGYPQQYYLSVNKIGIVPLPDAGYTINITYFNGPIEDLKLGESPALIPERWHTVLSYYIAAMLFTVDKGAYALAGQMLPSQWSMLFETQLQRMKNYYTSGMSADKKPEI